jgi:biotin carboxyl carrier protein
MLPVYEIFIDGKPRKIELTRTGENSFTAKTDDKSLSIELPSEKRDIKKAFSITINGKSYRIKLEDLDRDKIFPVKVEEASFKAEVKMPIRESSLTTFKSVPVTLTKRADAVRQVVEGDVTAPMTGKILSISVKKGDRVKAGQVLCVLEAMKMENEIATLKAGSVQEVCVSEGSSVSEGDVLFKIG